jgi:hypothetical protein
MSEPHKCGSAIAQAVMTVDSYRCDGASGLPRNILKHRAGTRHRLIRGFTIPPHGVEALHRRSYCAQRHLLTRTFATHDRSPKGEAPPLSLEIHEAWRKCASRNGRDVVSRAFPTLHHAGGFHG